MSFCPSSNKAFAMSIVVAALALPGWQRISSSATASAVLAFSGCPIFW